MIENKKFRLPSKFIEELYELSGSGNKNKGFFLLVVDEDGDPCAYYDFDSYILELGLRKCMEIYLSECDRKERFENIGDKERAE